MADVRYDRFGFDDLSGLRIDETQSDGQSLLADWAARVSGSENRVLTKRDIVVQVADTTGLSRQLAELAIETILGEIEMALHEGNEVRLRGFGTFSVIEHAAKTGRHPRTGKPVRIDAAMRPHFKPGKQLKEAVG